MHHYNPEDAYEPVDKRVPYRPRFRIVVQNVRMYGDAGIEAQQGDGERSIDEVEPDGFGFVEVVEGGIAGAFVDYCWGEEEEVEHDYDGSEELPVDDGHAVVWVWRRMGSAVALRTGEVGTRSL